LAKKLGFYLNYFWPTTKELKMKYGVKLTTTAQKERIRLDIEIRKRVDTV